jgi:hypothetical protein
MPQSIESPGKRPVQENTLRLEIIRSSYRHRLPDAGNSAPSLTEAEKSRRIDHGSREK